MRTSLGRQARNASCKRVNRGKARARVRGLLVGASACAVSLVRVTAAASAHKVCGGTACSSKCVEGCGEGGYKRMLQGKVKSSDARPYRSSKCIQEPSLPVWWAGVHARNMRGEPCMCCSRLAHSVPAEHIPHYHVRVYVSRVNMYTCSPNLQGRLRGDLRRPKPLRQRIPLGCQCKSIPGVSP